MKLRYNYVEEILRVIEEDQKAKVHPVVLEWDINKILSDLAQVSREEAIAEYENERY